MNILSFIFRPTPSWLSLLGWILVFIGLVLSVAIVGLPILFIGWLILLYDMFNSWYKALIPRKLREQMAAKLKKEYEPYKPAMYSLKGLILEMLKIAGFVFVTGVLIIILGFKFDWFGI